MSVHLTIYVCVVVFRGREGRQVSDGAVVLARVLLSDVVQERAVRPHDRQPDVLSDRMGLLPPAGQHVQAERVQGLVRGN